MNDLIMLGGLWLNEARSGERYMSGRLGLGGKILIFKNLKKGSENDPDYYLMIGEWQSEGKGQKGHGDKESEIPF